MGECVDKDGFVSTCDESCPFHGLQAELTRARELIAELQKERDEWKRRAQQHGCNVDEGDGDCG